MFSDEEILILRNLTITEIVSMTVDISAWNDISQ